MVMVVIKLKNKKQLVEGNVSREEMGTAKQLCAYLCPSAPHAMILLESGSSIIS